MTRYTALIDGTAGAYGVAFPDLPGCVAMGTTLDEALANAADALRDWAETMEELGEPLPLPHNVEALRADIEVRQALADGATLASVVLVRDTGRPVKANLSLDAGVLAAIDDEAKRRNLTRSNMVAWMARRVLTEG